METFNQPPDKQKPAIGAIVSGLFVAALGLLAATAQGMAAAPSAAAGTVLTIGIVLGLALALAGIASIWLPRLRKPARIGNTVVLVALVVAYLADRFLALGA